MEIMDLYGQWQHLEKYRSQNNPKSMMELQIVDASEIAAIESRPASPGIHFNGCVIRWHIRKSHWMIERGTGATPILSSGIPSKSC